MLVMTFTCLSNQISSWTFLMPNPVLGIEKNKETKKHKANKTESGMVLIRQSQSHLKIPRFGQMLSIRVVMVLGRQGTQLGL